MTKLKFDLAKQGLLCVLKPYQAKIMLFFWDRKHPMGSGAVHRYLQGLDKEVAMSRASIINFLDYMVDERFMTFVEKSGKGGYRRVYSLSKWILTEQKFRDEVHRRFQTRLWDFRKGMAEG